MTLGNRIKQVRIQMGISQEKLAEELNVSRSAIAKWETDGGVPELNNLLQIAKKFDISIDELTGNMEKQEKKIEHTQKAGFDYEFGNQYYDIDLTGWNDGVNKVSIVDEDNDFLFYKKMLRKKSVYGIIGKKYIASISPVKGITVEQNPAMKLDRDYFCGRVSAVELAKREGLIRGFLDFRDDDYRNIVIDHFGKQMIRLQFGREINVTEITKIEELID